MKTTQISIQETTNNTIIKFVSNNILINGGSHEFTNIDEAKDSPLAQQLFYLPFVKKIFVTANFIAVQRYDILEWTDVQEEVREQIEAYLNDGNAVIKEKITPKKEALEVYAESTPNPSVMKFTTTKSLTTQDVEYKNSEEASKSSPLAQAVFNFPFVKEVFISDNYISITKIAELEWSEIHPELRSFIKEYLHEGKTIISALPKPKSTETSTSANQNGGETENANVVLTETSEKIIQILEEYIKPAVASDGGNIAFQNYDEDTKVVKVILQGACSGCPSSTITLKNGIETMLKEMLPNQISEVVAINE